MKAQPIPTPIQIRLRCREAQAAWSEDERRRREVGRGRQWQPIVVPESIIQSARAYAAGCSESQEHTQHSATS